MSKIEQVEPHIWDRWTTNMDGAYSSKAVEVRGFLISGQILVMRDHFQLYERSELVELIKRNGLTGQELWETMEYRYWPEWMRLLAQKHWDDGLLIKYNNGDGWKKCAEFPAVYTWKYKLVNHPRCIDEPREQPANCKHGKDGSPCGRCSDCFSCGCKEQPATCPTCNKAAEVCECECVHYVVDGAFYCGALDDLSEDGDTLWSEVTCPECIKKREKPKCATCNDTGYYGDNGPGINGNSEYQPCECKQKLTDCKATEDVAKDLTAQERQELEKPTMVVKEYAIELDEDGDYCIPDLPVGDSIADALHMPNFRGVKFEGCDRLRYELRLFVDKDGCFTKWATKEELESGELKAAVPVIAAFEETEG